MGLCFSTFPPGPAYTFFLLFQVEEVIQSRFVAQLLSSDTQLDLVALAKELLELEEGLALIWVSQGTLKDGRGASGEPWEGWTDASELEEEGSLCESWKEGLQVNQGKEQLRKGAHLTLSTPVLPVGMTYPGASSVVGEVQEDKEERIVERKGRWEGGDGGGAERERRTQSWEYGRRIQRRATCLFGI